MKFAFSEKEKEKIIIDKVRQKIIEAIGSYNGIVRLDYPDFELDKILFNYSKDKTFKSFALPIEILRKIDMSNVSFDNFYADDVNFGPLTGVKIDPNKLYNKKALYLNFTGVTFLDKFRDCYVEGCRFGGSKNAVIGEGTELGKLNMFRSVTFEAPITKGVLDDNDFSGSKGAVIETGPNKVTSLRNCCLKDATLSGTFAKCHIAGTDFTGAHAKNCDKIKLDPFDLAESRVSGQIVRNVGECRFNGVKFTGSFGPIGDFAIRMADFTGSEGAVICPGSVFEKDYCYAKLSGVRFPAGSFIKDAQLEGTKFNGSEGAVISGPQQNMYVADLTDAAIRFNEPNDILYIHGVETAAYDKKAFCDVFNETLAREFEEPAKVYVKRIEKLGPKDKNQK